MGFFFLILTVQKLRSFTVLRAIGAGTGYLAWSVTIQIGLLVLLGSLLATAALWAATLRGRNPAFPLSVEGGLVITVTIAVLLSRSSQGYSPSAASRADPAEAARGTH